MPHLEPGMVPSTVDPDALGSAEKGQKGIKRPVRISAWKLAKLDSNEAVRAGAKARASSSVLRPVDRRPQDLEISSSGNLSLRSSVSTDMGMNKEIKDDLKLSPIQSSFVPSQGSRDEYETGTQSMSSFSSPSHIHETVTLSPLPRANGMGRSGATGLLPSLIPGRPLASRTGLPNATNPIPHYTTIMDERITQKGTNTDSLLFPTAATYVKRTSVVWDQEAGRYVSVPVSSADGRKKSSAQVELPNCNAEPNNNPRRAAVQLQESSSSQGRDPVPQTEKLMYTADSIFFGGPLLSVPVRDSLRNDKGSNQDRYAPNLPREAGLGTESTSVQLPVFAPKGPELKAPSGSGLK